MSCLETQRIDLCMNKHLQAFESFESPPGEPTVVPRAACVIGLYDRPVYHSSWAADEDNSVFLFFGLFFLNKGHYWYARVHSDCCRRQRAVTWYAARKAERESADETVDIHWRNQTWGDCLQLGQVQKREVWTCFVLLGFSWTQLNAKLMSLFREKKSLHVLDVGLIFVLTVTIKIC